MGFWKGLAGRGGITAHMAQNGLQQWRKVSLGFLTIDQFLNIAGLATCIQVPSQIKEFALLFSCSSEALLRLSITNSKVHQALTQFLRNMVTIGTHRLLDLSPTSIDCNKRQGKQSHHLTLSQLQSLGCIFLAYFFFFSDKFSIPYPFFFAVRVDFPSTFPVTRWYCSHRECMLTGVKWFSPFQILCQTDLNSTLFVQDSVLSTLYQMRRSPAFKLFSLQD